MNTTEIKVTQTHTTESMVKVEIPSYRQDGNWHFYKIISPEKCIQVFNGSIAESQSISVSGIQLALGENSKEITHEMFTEVYEKVINEINQL